MASERSATNSDQEWPVEDIFDCKFNSHEGKWYYAVQWRGWSDEYNTWEPEANLGSCPEKLAAFKRKYNMQQSGIDGKTEHKKVKKKTVPAHSKKKEHPSTVPTSIHISAPSYPSLPSSSLTTLTVLPSPSIPQRLQPSSFAFASLSPSKDTRSSTKRKEPPLFTPPFDSSLTSMFGSSSSSNTGGHSHNGGGDDDGHSSMNTNNDSDNDDNDQRPTISSAVSKFTAAASTIVPSLASCSSDFSILTIDDRHMKRARKSDDHDHDHDHDSDILRDKNDQLREQLRCERSELKAVRHAFEQLQYESKQSNGDSSHHSDSHPRYHGDVTDVVTSLCDAHTPIGCQWPMVRALSRNAHELLLDEDKNVANSSSSSSSSSSRATWRVPASILVGYIINQRKPSAGAMIVHGDDDNDNKEHHHQYHHHGYVSMNGARQLAQQTSVALVDVYYQLAAESRVNDVCKTELQRVVNGLQHIIHNIAHFQISASSSSPLDGSGSGGISYAYDDPREVACSYITELATDATLAPLLAYFTTCSLLQLLHPSPSPSSSSTTAPSSSLSSYDIIDNSFAMCKLVERLITELHKQERSRGTRQGPSQLQVKAAATICMIYSTHNGDNGSNGHGHNGNDVNPESWRCIWQQIVDSCHIVMTRAPLIAHCIHRIATIQASQLSSFSVDVPSSSSLARSSSTMLINHILASSPQE